MTTKNPGPVYPNLKPWELEPHYIKHVGAMTREGLHSKAAIAEQLAWRDKRIEELEGRVEALAQLILEAAPLAWAASGDMDGAQAWEKAAHEALNKVGYTGEKP